MIAKKQAAGKNSHKDPQSINFAKRLVLLLVLSLISMFFLKSLLSFGFAQTLEARDIEDKIPKHVPIKVRIRSEKEKAVKDLKNDKWLRDFELEVTNTSDKPIYFLELWIILPEVIAENGSVVGMPLRYGRMEFVHHNTLPVSDDVPIKPGESYTFKVPEKYQRGWYAHKAGGLLSDARKLQLLFVQLSFGDGTGFSLTDATPYPYKKEQSLANPHPGCSEEQSASDGWRNSLQDAIGQTFLQTKPAADPSKQ